MGKIAPLVFPAWVANIANHMHNSIRLAHSRSYTVATQQRSFFIFVDKSVCYNRLHEKTGFNRPLRILCGATTQLRAAFEGV